MDVGRRWKSSRCFHFSEFSVQCDTQLHPEIDNPQKGKRRREGGSDITCKEGTEVARREVEGLKHKGSSS